MIPAQNHISDRFNTENLTVRQLKKIVQLPYVEAMDLLYSITCIQNAKSKHFTQRKIELWTIMPMDWRMQEVVQLIEMENQLN